MAHFAKIENKKVIEVIVINNENINNLNFPESEPVGQDFIKSIGLTGIWLQASYNSNFRKHFPGPGYSYDPILDSFIPPCPFPSWKLNKNALVWESPVPYPDLNKDYTWNEEKTEWIEI
jgi:hypothetical protein